METFQIGKYFVCLNSYIFNIYCWKYFTPLIFAIELCGENDLMTKISSSMVAQNIGVKLDSPTDALLQYLTIKQVVPLLVIITSGFIFS